MPLSGRLFGRFGRYSRGRHHGGRGLWFTSTAAGELFVADVGQTADFQRLGDAQQRSDLFLIDVYLALVHKVDDRPEFGPLDVFKYDDRVLTLVFGKHALEVGAARGQHDLVRFERVTVTGDRHVHERAVLQQLVEHVGQVALVVVPAQAELLVAGTACRAASLLGRRRRRHVFGAVARLHGDAAEAVGYSAARAVRDDYSDGLSRKKISARKLTKKKNTSLRTTSVTGGAK